MVRVCKKLFQESLVQTTAGNVSLREEGSLNMYITCTGSCFKDITEEEIILVDENGNKLYGDKDPSVETPFHVSILKARDDLNAVIHTHSPAVTKLGIIGRTLMPTGINYLQYSEILKGIPLVPFFLPGAEQLKENVKMVFDDGYNIAFLQGHGAVLASTSLDKAFTLSLALETLAQEQVEVLKIGKPIPIPRRYIDEWLQQDNKDAV